MRDAFDGAFVANQTKIIMTDVVHGFVSEIKHSIHINVKCAKLQTANLVLKFGE